MKCPVDYNYVDYSEEVHMHNVVNEQLWVETGVTNGIIRRPRAAV